MAKKRFSREAEESMENKETIDNKVPENRQQADQQVATTDDAIATRPANSSFNAKRTKGKGAELKQQVISDVLTGSSNTAGMGVNAAGRSVSGTGGGILGANNSTPQADKSRSSSRVGKKLDRTATKLNFTPSETVLLEVDESKPLAAGAENGMGFNGTYRNEFARSQKIQGAVPADLLFQRSVDLITKDKLYFIEGQMVFQSDDDNTVYYPSTTVRGVDPRTGEPIRKPVHYHLGNFLHTNLHFKLDANGKVVAFYADVNDLTAEGVTPEDANSASAHRLIKSNVAELDRMAMDAAAGDEKADIWTPLARAIDEPTKASAVMSSIEATTGAYVHLAYSKATTNMSYQINRGPKDGLDEITPAVEELIGWRCACNNSKDLGDIADNVLDRSYIFNEDQYRLGDPAIMIDAYDSIAKYHNKADLLLQPRGFRMHLQTADNNMNPIRVPEEYANVYAATETFATVDHDYDPLMPICMTDKANLISPINLNEFCAFDSASRVTSIDLEIKYDTTASYTTASKNIKLIEHDHHVGVEALYVYYRMSEEEGYSTDATLLYNSTTHKITIKSHSPVGDRKAKYSILVTEEELDDELGYTLLVSADPATIDYDVIFVCPEEQEGGIEDVELSVEEDEWGEYRGGGYYAYAYSDLRNNYITKVEHPLISGMIEYLNNSIGAKIRSLIKQSWFTIPLVFSTQFMTLAQIFICAATPWIARVRANSMRDVIYYEDNVKTYPYSKLAPLSKVPFKVYTNMSYTDYDTPLETKIMNPVQAINWTMPEFFWKVATEKYVLPWYYNEVDLNDDGTVNDDASNMSMPSIRSGVRLGLLDNLYGMSENDIRLSLDRMTKFLLRDEDIASKGSYKYGRTTDGQILANLGEGKKFTIAKILSCPRELGLVMDAPLGVLTRDPADNTADPETGAIITHLKGINDDGTATSYRIRLWLNKDSYLHPSILAEHGVNITRAANYTQKWFELCANNATANTDVAGLVFGMGDDVATFSPFAALGTGASLGNGVNVTSYQRSLNTRLQFLPFVISPFDGNHVGEVAHDIYDFAYMFGLCGFRASDYRECVYNREKQVVNEGLLFVNDPWIQESPIIRGAAANTGLALSKGYELK